jgi:hypothetical protein
MSVGMPEILVLIFLGLVVVWLFARLGVRDGVFLFVGGIVMEAVAGSVFWLLGSQTSADKQLMVHLLWTAIAGALVGLPVKLARNSKKRPPDAPIS